MSLKEASVERREPEWKEGLWGRGPRIRPRPAAGALFVVVGAALLSAWSPAAAILWGAASVLAVVWMRGRHRRALGRSGAVGLGPDEGDRLRNLAHGIAGDLGIDPPSLFLIEEGGPNALVTGGSAPALAVSRSAIDNFTRTEIEAMVAHCLVRLKTGRLGAAGVFGGFGGRFGEPIGESDDLRTVSLTRYPPALRTAIEKAEPRSGRDASSWFVAEGPSHQTPAERAEALADL